MATVSFSGNLTRVVLLEDRNDPNADVHLPAPSSYSVSTTGRGGVKQYAGGVRRAVTLPGKVVSVSVEFQRPSWQIVETLKSWSGQVVLYRDMNANLLIGVLRSVREINAPRTPAEFQQADNISIVIETTTDTPETIL